MKITDLRCALIGKHPIVRIVTDEGLYGLGEVEFTKPYLKPFVLHFREALLGEDPTDVERCLLKIRQRGSFKPYGAAVSAIEHALWDIAGKAANVPAYKLLGGKVRDRIRLYWSHCATWRINHPTYYKPPITDLDGVKAMGAEVKDKGFSALKTNIFIHGENGAKGWRPGFGTPFMPELNVDRHVLRNLRAHLEAFRDGCGPDVDMLLDLNFNAKTEGYLKILREIADLDMFWIEIDSYNAQALAYIRSHSHHPISSCETLLGLREFLPYFQHQSMDVAIIDAVWNGVWQSMKIAASAEAHEMNVAPHNFYGHLCTMMNAHFAAAVPNLRIMEIDIDRLEWDHELFTVLPPIEDGHLVIPDTPGWGTEPNEEAIRARPPKGGGGMLPDGKK